ncbi:MAG: hypothetical protein L7R66_02100 [Candidatus Thalassarchaeaceae archaeon]|nr:hypothetical protein [Candidatus Thalassarchaeaceae archaeon]
MQYMLCCGAMGDGESSDKIIREREFKLPSGIDIGNLHVPAKEESEENSSVELEDKDDAIGDIFDPFTEPDEDSPGMVSEDGSVDNPPERDLVSQIAIEGEERVSWVLMVSMIVLYSAISIQIGRTFDPIIGTLLLLFLAALGFGLGELWVPKEKMKLLGVTWVIISMKVLYGLAIELRHWEIIGDDISLGVVLLLLVGANISIAYRHDHDAIAAQSTLVLLAIGSTAGTEFGEAGVAGMILLATVILHGIALNRNSGNLASLGIASSNLWIGMHAVTSRFSVGPLDVLPIEGSLLLFLLLMSVTSMNAYMATKFAKKGNWFSKGFETLGLGKPGLWGVSISLGMIGALLAVASNREDLGYALGMVTFLGGAFGGSYLVVRGVEARRVYGPLVISASLLTIVLLNGELVEEIFGASSYQIFTIVGASTTVAIVLRDQSSVTDRVLWIGSVAILAILVLLVPTGNAPEGDGGVMLLGVLSVLHIGTAALAIKRSSPSLSGVTVLLPWSWILIEKLVEETVRTIMLANDISDYTGVIHLETTPLALYLGLASALLFIVNSKMGSTGVNLASGFLGITEISATIRDSGLLNLWSIGLWLPMLTILILAQFGGFTSVSLVTLLALLSGLHILSSILGFRDGDASGIVWIISLTFLIIQWRHGLDEAMMVLMGVSIASILYFESDSIFSLGLGMMAIPMLVFSTGRSSTNELITPDWLPELNDGGLVGSVPEVEFFALLSTVAMLAIFLPRAEEMEKLLKPASSALILIVITNALTMRSNDLFLQVASVSIFVATSIWLISRGEIRSELRTIAKRDSIVSMVTKKGSFSSSGSLASYRPKIAEMGELRRSKRELSDTDDMAELLNSDTTHNPIVGLVVLAIVLASGILSSAWGLGPLVLIATGTFCCVIVFLIRNRTRELELELPHFLGMEMPIALSIIGICLMLVSGHVFPPGGSPDELLDMAVVCVLLLVMLMISLLHRENLLDRISIAIDWFVLPLLMARLVASALVGALPPPLLVDPFDGDQLEWTGPWLLLESVLVLCVLVDYWVDEKRESLGKEDMNNGVRMGARCLAIVMMSFGPAGLLAASSTSLRSIRTSRPSGLGIALPGGMVACFALLFWNGAWLDLFGELMLIFGALVMLSCALSVPLNLEKWTITLAVDGHLFVISGAIAVGMVGGFELPLLLILMSTTIWVIGILQLRKALRIWGFADLIAALLCSFVFASKGVDQYEILLGMAALAVELGIIAWLGLSNQDELRKD